ncbi:MAG: glyceraldehyde 3-phosphate dehydrogenase NAD-binding domain-containing protein, partial [Nannocystaceae bacterium]
MATVRIGINGMGRIGRLVLRHALARAAGTATGATRTGCNLEIVAANDLASAEDLAYLIGHDSVHRCNLPNPEVVDGAIHVGPFRIALSAQRDPAAIDWAAHNVDVVLECTGKFTNRDGMARHLEGKGKAPARVILGAPGKGVDRTIVVGVNESTLTPEDRLISNASCTTNALAPVMAILHRAFGVRWALMGTTHAYTGGQGIVDVLNPKDYRRGRAAAVNIV